MDTTASGRRRMSRRGAAAAAAVAGLALAGAALGAPAANADTLPNGATVGLSSTPVPAVPPAYVPTTDDPYGATSTDGGALPDQNGAMGNPVQLTMTSGQVLAVQGGSAAWGTPVATENPTGSASEIWRFQRVGWVDVTTGNEQTLEYETGFLNGPDPQEGVMGEPVYKIVNYNADGSYTCLDADGNDIAEGGAITSYGCDPNGVNQTNQLWIVAGNQGDLANNHQWAFPDGTWTDESTPADGNELSYTEGTTGQYSLINLASVVSNGMDMYNALIASSAGSNIQGVDSTSMLWSPTDWPASTSNSLYGLSLVVPPAPTNPITCSMFACIVNGV